MKTITARLSILAALILSVSICSHAIDKPVIFKPYTADGFMICGMSDNGRYVISQKGGNQDVDNPQPAGGTVLDITTMQYTSITAPSGWAGISDVADNGVVVGSLDGKPASWDPATGTWTAYPPGRPADCGSLLAVTPDAHYAVGYLGRSEDFLYATPCCVDLTTGSYIEITNLPEVDLSGQNQNQNVFFGISPDGRYILGQMSQSYLLPLSMFSYIYDTQTHTWQPIGYDYDTATKKYTSRHAGLHFISDQRFSPDGSWVTGKAYIVNNGGDSAGGSEYYVPYRYNVAADQLELYTGTGDQDVAGNNITNDGVVLGCAPAEYPYPTAVIRSGNFFISLDMILSQVYGMNLMSQIGDNCSGAFSCVSADGLTAGMISYDNCYIIQMPEPFTDAAAKVDLMANYTVSIPVNTEMAKISELKITYDREIQCMNYPSSVQLLKSDGSVVRNATSTVIAASNSHQLVVTFRTQALEPGEQYTVRIPAGYVWLKDDTSVKSREINLCYFGRANEPVEPVQIIPANGSVLAELNSETSYITVIFDTDVKISDSASCLLYNADDEAPLTRLQCTASADKAFFFTDGSYPLYYGSEYRIEIAEGSVTDLSGSGPCQAITLNYRGSYVRQATDDDIYLFSSDCSNYDKFIYWANETYEPGQVAKAWGFEADNSWILVRDSEDTYDWAMCAHSMFAASNTSDDWLVIPQLYIPDQRSALEFDAQSYLKSKSDRLQIYVYPCNTIYNYFSTKLTEDVRRDGHLVFDEVLSPGVDEEVLAGDWTHYRVDLAQYAGQNIYIAFVNNNTDQSAVFIDNVAVTRDLDFILTNSTPQTVVAQDGIYVQGILTPPADNIEFAGVKFSLLDANGTLVDTIDDPQAVVSTGTPFSFRFATALPLTIGEVNSYTIEVTVNDKATALDYTVKDLAFSVDKSVVLEEYSGASCSNCPQGFRAADNIAAIYGEAFIPVILRTYGDDALGVNVRGYSEFLGMELVGAPSGRINRSDVLMPMLNNNGQYSFTGRGVIQSDGTEAYLWTDAAQDEMATAAEIAIDCTADYDESTSTLTIPVTVRNALNATDRTINLFAVVTEDNLITSQSNGFSTVSDPALGEWGVGGQYASSRVFPYIINHVARYVVNGSAYNGTPMSVSTFVAGESYSQTLTTVIPDGAIKKPANCHVVVMAIDGSSHTILNAHKAAFTQAGINSAELDGVSVTISGNGALVKADGHFTATAYSVTGSVIASVSATDTAQLDLSGYHGIVIVNVTTGLGSYTVKLAR